MSKWVSAPVYEVIRLMEGEPLFFEEHMSRMRESLRITEASYTLDASQIYQDIKTLAVKEAIVNQNVRIEVGQVDQEGSWALHLFFVPSKYPEHEEYLKGVKTVTTHIVRNTPHAKVFNSAYQEHVQSVREVNEAFEVIIMDESGKIAEGSKSNLFFVKDQVLYSAKAEDILMGITREKVLEVAKNIGVKIIEKDLYIKDINQFDGCFLSGTSIHILPICQIDDIPYPSSTLPTIVALMEGLNKLVKHQIQNTKGVYENE